MTLRSLLALTIGTSIHAFLQSYSSFHKSVWQLQQIQPSIEHSNHQTLQYEKCFEIIDSCATSSLPNDELYKAVRFIDKNGSKLYPDLTSKAKLWDRCHGSWKLQLATGPPKSRQEQTFKPVPIFAFAIIDDNHFGNGIGINQHTIILSLLGPHYFDEKRRQMGIGISDMYLFSFKVTQFIPEFIVERMGLGKKPADFGNGSRMPAFTIIGASDTSLIARGGSGGIAIWSKLENDIRPVAYGL